MLLSWYQEKLNLEKINRFNQPMTLSFQLTEPRLNYAYITENNTVLTRELLVDNLGFLSVS